MCLVQGSFESAEHICGRIWIRQWLLVFNFLNQIQNLSYIEIPYVIHTNGSVILNTLRRTIFRKLAQL